MSAFFRVLGSNGIAPVNFPVAHQIVWHDWHVPGIYTL